MGFAGVAPDFVADFRDDFIALRIMLQARRRFRFGADDRCAGGDERFDFFRQRRRHHRSFRQHQHAVTHTVRQHELAVFHRHPLNQRLGADLVKAITGGRRRIGREGGLVRRFRPQVKQVGNKFSLA